MVSQQEVTWVRTRGVRTKRVPTQGPIVQWQRRRIFTPETRVRSPLGLRSNRGWPSLSTFGADLGWVWDNHAKATLTKPVPTSTPHYLDTH